MSNLAFYRKGATLLISPKDNPSLVLEATILAKSEPKGKHKKMVQIKVPHRIDMFGEKYKTFDGENTIVFTGQKAVIVPGDTTWVAFDDWDVIGKVNKPKEAK